MTRVEPRPLEEMSSTELEREVWDWMDMAIWSTTALGEAKDLLLRWQAGQTPDTDDLEIIDHLLHDPMPHPRGMGL
jgi:hypothetical protein